MVNEVSKTFWTPLILSFPNIIGKNAMEKRPQAVIQLCQPWGLEHECKKFFKKREDWAINDFDSIVIGMNYFVSTWKSFGKLWFFIDSRFA